MLNSQDDSHSPAFPADFPIGNVRMIQQSSILGHRRKFSTTSVKLSIPAILGYFGYLPDI